MPTLTATPNFTRAAVAVTINWSDTVAVTGNAARANLYRINPDGTQTEVLGSPAVLSRGVAMFWDTTAPLDVSIRYRATSPNTATILTTSNLTVTGTGYGWLKDPAEPINDLHLVTCPRGCDGTGAGVSFLGIGSGEFDAAGGVFPIVNAARPRSVAQIRKARTSSLTLETHSLTDIIDMEDIHASGRNLLLQLAATYGWQPRLWGSDYIRVDKVTETRPPTARMNRPQRAWALPFTLARAPYVRTGRTGGNGIGILGATYGDATATGRTYAVRTSGKTYLQSSRGENL